MPLDKGSLILLDYTAKIKDSNEVFETTRIDDVKDTSDFDPNKKYEPRLLGVGEGWVLKGLDEALLNSNIGEQLDIEIPPEKAFGERDPSKVRMIPLRKLGEKANEVSIGDVIEIDDRIGIIRFIGSGRVQVDFNHKYAGRTLLYNANIVKKLDDDSEKILNLIKRRLPLEPSDLKFEMKEQGLEVTIPEKAYLVDGIQIIKRGISNDIFKFLPDIKDITFLEKYINTSYEKATKEEKVDDKETSDNIKEEKVDDKETSDNIKEEKVDDKENK